MSSEVILTNEATPSTPAAGKLTVFSNSSKKLAFVDDAGNVTAISAGGITVGTSVATTSGTSVDYTSLPAGINRITMIFNGVSTTGTSLVEVQLGTSSTPKTSGYSGSYGAGTSNGQNSTGFVCAQNNGAADTRYGTLVLCQVSTNVWIANGNIGINSANTPSVCVGAVTLSGTLDMIRLTTVGGTDTFDAGSINIIYE